MLCQCHNFKDPSVQLYGGSMFRASRCITLRLLLLGPLTRRPGHRRRRRRSILHSSCPRPQIHCHYYCCSGNSLWTRRHVHVLSLSYHHQPVASCASRYMDRRGGCFAPQSPVKLFDGTSCDIQFLRRGMRVWGGACVQYVLRMNYNAVVPMVSLQAASGTGACILAPIPTPSHLLSGSAPAVVTPWHPVLFAGEWSFPCSIRSPSPFYMDCVYNVVLSAGHVIVINGLQFITLGHGNDSHPVLAHAFFGTQVSSCLSGFVYQARDARARRLCARCFRETEAKAWLRSAASSGMQSSGKHTQYPQHHSRRDRNGLVCGFRDDEEPTHAQFTHNCSPLLQVSCQ